jgi:hypothetical protein
LNSEVQIGGASVAGWAHAVVGRNNQDGYAFTATPEGLVAVVCDGCSSAPHSEVGAKLGAELVVSALARRLPRTDACDEALREVRETLRTFALPARTYFLFTVVGVVIAGGRVQPFALGDGVIAVDDRVQCLGPFPDNAPPYLCHSHAAEPTAGLWIAAPSAWADVERIVLATDGAVSKEGAVLPAIAGLWKDDRAVGKPDWLRRQLLGLSRARQLWDDTTLVIVRRQRGTWTST